MDGLKQRIFKEIEKKGSASSGELAVRFRVTRQAIHRHLCALAGEGRILRTGSGRRDARYVCNSPAALRKALGRIRRFSTRVAARGLEEDRLLGQVEGQPGLLTALSPDARTSFGYAFTEMVNNAIEHSCTTSVEIEVAVGAGRCTFVVKDAGIGIFRNIQEKLGLASELEALSDLLKGRQTTMPERHSGEGIFFTSKIADRFVIESHQKRLIVDNDLDDVFVEQIRFRKGTRIFFELRIASRRRLDELFHAFTKEDFAFQKSSVRVKLFAGSGAYISRSQAKRLVHSLEQFREIVLDFNGVPSVGQAFADEVFRVFQAAHPGIAITAVNCSEHVLFMIERARAILPLSKG